jgi:diguanylate cyclase (GGDEF)-like protein/PAS domain S-box-containing protein
MAVGMNHPRGQTLRFLHGLLALSAMAFLAGCNPQSQQPPPPIATNAPFIAFLVLLALAAYYRVSLRLKRLVEDQAELQRQRDRFRSLVETTVDWIWEVDEQGVYTYASPRVRDLLGYEPEEVIGRTPFDFMPPAEAQRARAEFDRIRAERRAFTALETINLSKDSRQVVMETSGAPILNEHGQLLGYRGIDRDITERKRVEERIKESEARFRRMADSAPTMIWLIDAAMRYTYCNTPWLEFSGHTLEEETGELWGGNVHPADYDSTFAAFVNAYETRKPFQDEYRLRRHDGKYRWVIDRGTPCVEPDGTFTGYIGSCIDITARKQAEESLRAANEQLGDTLDQLTRHDREMTLINQMDELLQNCQNQEEAYRVIGISLSELFSGQSGALARLRSSGQFLDTVARWGPAPNLESVFPSETCWALRRGHPHIVADPVRALSCQHFDHPSEQGYICLPLAVQGELIGLLHLDFAGRNGENERIQRLLVTVGEAIKLSLSNIRLRELLREQATHDPLTGLCNRRYLDETLPREVHRALRMEKPLCVAMLDIDHFKRFNDRFGHEAGDIVLRRIGQLLLESLRKSDIACRYGGEELTIVLPDSSLEDARTRMEEISRRIKTLELQYGSQNLPRITLSCGVAALCPEHAANPFDLLNAADQALYRAKQAGRDRLVVYGEE